MGYQYKFDIAGTEYGMEDVKSVRLETPLSDGLSVGNACAAELDITFWPKSVVPRMARIIPYIEVDGSWFQLGEFFTDTRSQSGDVLNILAYDAMLKAEIVWEPDQSLVFPMTMRQAVDIIADIMDVEIDPRTVVSDVYVIDYPANDYTLREILGYIGGAHAGNWIITRDGKLLLVPLFRSAPEETYHLIDDNDGGAITFGGVRIRV